MTDLQISILTKAKKSPYAPPERYTEITEELLVENATRWFLTALKRLLDEDADHKTENCSEIPNNCEPQRKYPCDTCANKGDHDGECKNCVADSAPIRWKTPSHYKPMQTERSE